MQSRYFLSMRKFYNNKFLINSKLVITIVQKASLLLNQIEENYADVLFDIAVQLAKILQLPEFLLMLYPSELESQRFLLGQLIQASAPGNVNFEIVDSLLFCNLDKFDEKFIKVLKEQVDNLLSQADPEQAQGIASAINNISGRIEILPIGNRANNLEIVINGYEIAQTVFISDTFKEEWVKLQNNLGDAYRKRIAGDTKENLNSTKLSCGMSLHLVQMTTGTPPLRTALNNSARCILHPLLLNAVLNFHKYPDAISQYLQASGYFQSPQSTDEQWYDNPHHAPHPVEQLPPTS